MKIAPELHEEILARVAAGASTRAVAEWLQREKAIKVSHVAVGNIVRKHRAERREITKHVVEAHVEATLPKDLEVYDRRLAELGALVDGALKAAHEKLTQATADVVTKLWTAYQRADEAKKKALGLEQPDEVVTDLATLLAKA